MNWAIIIAVLFQPDIYAVAYHYDRSWDVVRCDAPDRHGDWPPFNLYYIEQYSKFGSFESDHLRIDEGTWFDTKEPRRVYTCLVYCPSYEVCVQKTWLSELVRWYLNGRAYVEWDCPV